MILLADSKGSDLHVLMHRLSWAFVARICPKTQFLIARPVKVDLQSI